MSSQSGRGESSRHRSLSTVITKFPPQRSCRRSRWRVGITSRPFTSRVSLLAPRNIFLRVRKPIFSHNFPPVTTIGIEGEHCQRLMVKKTRPDSDLGHILTSGGALRLRGGGESIPEEFFV